MEKTKNVWFVLTNKQKKKKSVWELLNPECNSPTRARIFSIFPPNASNYRNKTIYVSQKTKNEQKSLMWPRYLISLLGISKGRVRWMNHSQIRMVVLLCCLGWPFSRLSSLDPPYIYFSHCRFSYDGGTNLWISFFIINSSSIVRRLL